MALRGKADHPYLKGNYSPVKRELGLTACQVTHGKVPSEFAGGQYVRNGGNALTDQDDQREAHWFDGDGMLTGVLFQRSNDGKGTTPQFINRYILTDVLLSTAVTLKRPFLPSITTFASPFDVLAVVFLLFGLLRTFLLALLSWLPFQRTPGLARISVANTSVWWHDGQAFAGCESGPPIRVLLPGLETAGWWCGNDAKGKAGWAKGMGPIKMLNEFTTAHPRIDPVTNELLLYHMSFVAPFLRVSVIPPRSSTRQPLLAAPVPGMKQPKLAHDFCATSDRTILIDMPMVLDPRNLLLGKTMLEYQSGVKMRFGVLPRWRPDQVVWFESEGCCIYHAANAWDDEERHTTSVLACRLNSATLVYSAGNIVTPSHARAKEGVEKCQLYYWQLSHKTSSDGKGVVDCEFPLSDIPLEFPTMNEAYSQRSNKFIYGASMTSGTFDAGLGTRSAKIDCIAKFNVKRLIATGKERKQDAVVGPAVDLRTVREILEEDRSDDPIQIFALPPHHYAQEATFVPRLDAAEEDDGYLTFFVFDEQSGLDEHGDCAPRATSQLWIIDAKNMKDVICKVRLPQRVPYGLHGHWFSEHDIQSQVAVPTEDVRTWALSRSGLGGPGLAGLKSMPPTGASRLKQQLTFYSESLRSFFEHCLA
ncbi:hypothetical protein CBS101457_004653 [Exobasidium rhododendri]|nr:hypothetical protein CBS101457_004653 [Exobasidium rhododendri]